MIVKAGALSVEPLPITPAVAASAIPPPAIPPIRLMTASIPPKRVASWPLILVKLSLLFFISGLLWHVVGSSTCRTPRRGLVDTFLNSSSRSRETCTAQEVGVAVAVDEYSPVPTWLVAATWSSWTLLTDQRLPRDTVVSVIESRVR